MADLAPASASSGGGTSVVRSKLLVRRSAASSPLAPQYGDGDFKGLTRSVPAPRALERCAALRSGLVTGYRAATSGGHLEFTTQFILYQGVACRKRPELRCAACA